MLDRRDAADDVGLMAAPRLLDAQELYVALADADAAASTAFLRAGLEPRALRATLPRRHRRGRAHLAGIADRDGLVARRAAAVATIAQQLPVYTGCVESARTNNRLGLPVGAAYLRQASDLMRTSPAGRHDALSRRLADQLDGGYRAGTSDVDRWSLIVVAAAS